MIRHIRESWEMASQGGKRLAGITGIAAVLLLVAIVWISSNWSGKAAPPDEAALQSQEPLPSVADSLAEMGYDRPMTMAERAVLDQHFAALGGFDAISSVSSLRFSGKVKVAGGVAQEVVAIKKGHDRIRLTLRNNVSQMSICVSPKDSWKAQWRNGALVSVTDLSPQEIEDQRWYIYMVSELFLAMDRGWEFSYIGVRDFNYRMCHVFEVRPHPRHTVRFFIDPETFLDLGREDKVFQQDGTLTITRRMYADHFQAGPMMFPRKVEVYIDGELVHELEISRAEINPGVLNTVFDRPGPLSRP